MTTYHSLHRHDFGLDDAPIGPCILYAVSCGLSDSDLTHEYDLLAKTGGAADDDNEEEATNAEGENEVEEGTGSKVRLKAWNQRKGKSLGYDGDGRRR